MLKVRILTPDDAIAARELRLRSLKEHPSAYGSAYDDERQMPLEAWAERFTKGLPNTASFGAFWDAELVGINALVRNTGIKLRHRATIVAMYTLPERRGQGVGAALVQVALGYARTLEGVEDVNLAVTVGNTSAKALYEKMGFKVYSYDPRFIRVDDHFFDLEWMILSLKETSE